MIIEPLNALNVLISRTQKNVSTSALEQLQWRYRITDRIGKSFRCGPTSNGKSLAAI